MRQQARATLCSRPSECGISNAPAAPLSSLRVGSRTQRTYTASTVGPKFANNNNAPSAPTQILPLRVVADKTAEAGRVVADLVEHRPCGRLLLALQRQLAQAEGDKRLGRVREVGLGVAVAE